MGVGDGGTCQKAKKNREKYFLANFMKNSSFFGQILCKIREFLYFSSKYHVYFEHFVNFSYTYFGQNVFPPKLTYLLRLRHAHVPTLAYTRGYTTDTHKWQVLINVE